MAAAIVTAADTAAVYHDETQVLDPWTDRHAADMTADVDFRSYIAVCKEDIVPRPGYLVVAGKHRLDCIAAAADDEHMDHC